MLAVLAVGSLPACDAGTGPAQAELPAELAERIEWPESNAAPSAGSRSGRPLP
jgi:hypothetical protein